MADLFQTSLKEYMIKGFTMDDERLKNLGGGNYWKELLERIRDIRSSEKIMYRQVLDLYATSVDYDPTGGFPPIPLYRNRSRPPLHLCGRAEPECGQELHQVLCRCLP